MRAIVSIGLLAGLMSVLAACSRHDSMFSMAPHFKGHSDADESIVAQCIASRWQSGTRAFKREQSGDVIRMRAQTFFDGVTIGVRVRKADGRTLVEYFERRYADPLYESMIKGCLSP